MPQDDTKYELKDKSQFHDGEITITFRAQDITLPAVLECAAVLADACGSPHFHAEHLRAIRTNVKMWQSVNRDKVKAPD